MAGPPAVRCCRAWWLKSDSPCHQWPIGSWSDMGSVPFVAFFERETKGKPKAISGQLRRKCVRVLRGYRGCLPENHSCLGLREEAKRKQLPAHFGLAAKRKGAALCLSARPYRTSIPCRHPSGCLPRPQWDMRPDACARARARCPGCRAWPWWKLLPSHPQPEGSKRSSAAFGPSAKKTAAGSIICVQHPLPGDSLLPFTRADRK